MTVNWRRAPYLTLTEAATILGVSRSQVYVLAQAGDLRTHQDDLGRRRVKPADLEPLLAAQEAEAAAQPDLFSPEAPDAIAQVTEWLASVADPDGVIRDPQAVAMIQEALSDG